MMIMFVVSSTDKASELQTGLIPGNLRSTFVLVYVTSWLIQAIKVRYALPGVCGYGIFPPHL